MDYDESIRVMIKFIARQPLSVPLTNVPDPSLLIRLLHKAFERIIIEDYVLETVIFGDSIVPIHKKPFLVEIRMPENPQGFTVQEPTPQEFQSFVNVIGYAGELKAKQFKKSVVPILWTLLIHLILRGLSGNMVVLIQ